MIELGQQFVVMGDWDTSPEPEGKIIIRMPVPPHHTYGCWHDTTRMCIEELEKRVEFGVVGRHLTVLDFGTGSGILAMVAWHLGAAKVYATEMAPEVVKFAQKVWALNDVPVVLVEGDLPEVDLCVANVGDNFWDFRPQVKAKVIINISNAGKVVTEYAS